MPCACGGFVSRKRDEKFLEPIPPFVAWLERSQIATNRWARYYELDTNKPIYGDRMARSITPSGEISAERPARLRMGGRLWHS